MSVVMSSCWHLFYNTRVRFSTSPSLYYMHILLHVVIRFITDLLRKYKGSVVVIVGRGGAEQSYWKKLVRGAINRHSFLHSTKYQTDVNAFSWSVSTTLSLFLFLYFRIATTMSLSRVYWYIAFTNLGSSLTASTSSWTSGDRKWSIRPSHDWKISWKVRESIKKTRHLLEKHGCPRRQQSQNMTNISKS